MLLLAQEAAAAVSAEPNFWTWIFGAAFGGAVVMRLSGWLGNLLEKRAVASGQRALTQALDKLNAGVGANVHLDDVLITMAYKLLPVVAANLNAELRNALADGKISAEERKAIAGRLWEHVQGVFKDDKAKYLQGYAKEDGVALMAILVDLWAARRKKHAA